MSRIEGGAAVAPPVIQDPVPGGDEVPIEPPKVLPAPDTFKPGVGTWVGTGVGTLFGAGLGAGAGAIALGALSHSAGGGFFSAANVGMAVGGVLGAVGGAFAVYHMIKGGHDSGEKARIQADYGTSTLQYSKDLIGKFDHDRSGAIDLVNKTGLAGQDERVFTETREQSDTDLKYDWWDDDWDTETTRWSESRGVSAVPLWTTANVDPKDDTVSDVELARLMSKYDVDRTGSLTTAEQEAFKAAHPFILDQWRR